MYLNILKKDLKNKKVMNIILLVFIILATMFVASSVNNIVMVTSALDNFMEMANVPDMVIGAYGKSDYQLFDEVLSSATTVKSYSVEDFVMFMDDEVDFSCTENDAPFGSFIAQSDKNMYMNFFLEDGSILEDVKQGEFYINTSCVKELGIKKGDTLTLTKGDLSCELVCAGIVKDAMCGSNASGTLRCLLDDEAFQKFAQNEFVKLTTAGKMYNIETDDIQEFANENFAKFGKDVGFSATLESAKETYIFDMIVTGIILVVSVVLIAVAFMVLRFSITYTLTEEYREIGIMKAIGVSNSRIRGLYIVKYVAMAIVGALVGFGLSFPFSDMLATMASQSIVLGGTNPVYINGVCALFVVGIIVLFCYLCTNKVRKLSPIDAIRNGQTGERFRKKSIMSLSKSKMSVTPFLAINDVVSSPKRYVTITITFFLCALLAMMMSTVVNTMKDGSLVTCFGLPDIDAALDIDFGSKYAQTGGREILEADLQELEMILAENGMPAKCSYELSVSYPFVFGEGETQGITYGIQMQQGTGTTTDEYEYIRGEAPKNINEVAITMNAAKERNLDIGDTITIQMPDGDRKYTITALMQVMNGGGSCLRFHQDEVLDYGDVSGWFNYIFVKFTDNPSESEIADRIEKIKALNLNIKDVKSAAELAESNIGVVDTLEYVQMFITILTVVLVVMLTVLLEISFITKEKSDIALMKATGMKNGKIIGQQVMRFVFVAVIAVLLAWILALPMTHLCIDPVFKMMGMALAVDYNINPSEMFIIFPVIILVSTTLSATLTALMTKKIKPVDIASIE